MAAPPPNLNDLALRPNEAGNLGRATQVRANLFRATPLPYKVFHHYQFQVNPALPEQKMRALWVVFEDTYRDATRNELSICDGRKNVFSYEPFDLGEAQERSFVVIADHRYPFNLGGDTVFDIRLKLVNTFDMQDLRDFINGESPCTPSCLIAIMMLNILVRYVPSLNTFTDDCSLFTSNQSVRIPNGVEVWYGYHQSLLPAQGVSFINIDLSAIAMYESGPLLDVVGNMINRDLVNNLNAEIPERDLELLTRLLQGLTIQVTHRGEPRPSFTITNIAAPATQLVVNDRDGTLVSDYFRERYNRPLIHPFLPCVVVDEDTFLPMEVCEITPGQPFTQPLNTRQTAEFITATANSPRVRFNKINGEGLNIVRHKSNAFMNTFGLFVNQEMEEINARILDPPQVAFGQAHIIPRPNGWTLRGMRFANPCTLQSWAVVDFTGAFPGRVIRHFLGQLLAIFTRLGMAVPDRDPYLSINLNPRGNIQDILMNAWVRAGRREQVKPQLIVCILPNRDSQLYSNIKRITDTVIGVPSQCMQFEHILNPRAQSCAHIALKVNAKLGGVNHTLPLGEIPFITDAPTIVFGIDINHPSPGSNAPSIAAITASIGSTAARYVATIRRQARSDIVADLSSAIVELLRKFFQLTGNRPQRMLIYRNGVADAQFQQVKTQEVNAIKQACQRLEANYKPTITFVVVQRTHRVRFCPMNPNDADGRGNCLPGLVVDTQIVHPFGFDFYLQSHAALRGTARPARYCVLQDENQFDANSLQDLTHKLCYIYARSTGPVSIVPAVYYAGIVADRARLHYPQADLADRIKDTMYFM